MDIRRFFGVQTSKTVAAGSSKKSEADEKSRGSSEKFHGKVRKSEKGNDNRKKKTSKTSESDDDKPLRRRKTKDKKKNIKAFDSDSSEEEPLPAKLRKRSKKSAKDKKGRATTVISSDEEDTLLARLNKSTKNGETSKSVSQETSVPKKSPVKIIEDISEYFGTKPVERTFKRAHSMKRKERSEDVNCLADEKQTNNLNNNGHETETVGRTSARQDEIAPEQPFKKVKRSSYDAGRTCSSSQDKDKHQVERSSQEIRTKSTSEHEKHSPSSESTASHKSASTVKSTSPTKVISPSESTTPSKSTPTTYTTPVSKPTSKAKAASETKSTPTTQSTPLKSREKTSDAADVVPSSLERKSSGYRNYMMREGPQALGSKEIPKGSENCLAGLVFVVTGVLESIEREDALDLIKRYGGKVTQAVSKKTSYLVVGREAGNSKLDKAKQLGTRQIDEDGLFDIIRASSKKSAKATETPEMNKQKDSPEKPLTPSTSRTESQTSDNFSPSQRPSQSSLLSSACSTPATQTPSASPLATDVERESLLWVDKYSPKSIKQIIGQQGDRSNVKKLLRWLQNWHANQKAGKSKGGYFAGKEDGSIFKAALLSGPPGVGKTTSAHLVCKESGFSFVEFNASDSRNRKTLEELVAELLNNRTMDSFLLSSEPRPSSERHALIMDEVDGMAGNEDRGGMQELIALIKSSKIPIICMCNDRNSQKVRSLANYCFDLRFQKPRVEQIKGAMLSIAFKEGLKVSPQAMEKVIVGANQDIRQVLHNLSMWTSRQKSLNYDEAKADSDKAHKDIKLGPFDVTRKIFSAEESSKMNMQEYFSLFFNDYSLIPLFSQENYLQVVPFRAGGNSRKILNCLSEAAESFCDADLVDKLIRSNGSWNLLPLQSFFSCVLPGKMMQGRVGQRIEFPSWLGKHSTTGKNSRILQDLVCHTQLSVSGSKRELNLDYIPFLRKALSSPLIHANTENCSSKVSEVMEVMDSYHLLKEDWETVLEVGQFENKPKLMAGIDSKVKAAFTRAYNKEAHMAPYSSSQAAAKKKSGRAPSTLETEGMEVGQEEEETGSDDDLEHDAMIKVKKPSKAGRRGKGKTSKSNSGPKESKGARGKGVGKGKGKKP